MTVALIVVSCAFTVYMLYKMVAPFFQARAEQVRFDVLDDELRQVEELVSIRAMLMSNLSELDHDHEVGKVSDEDYRSLKKSYERRAIGVMRKLDTIHGGRDWEARIEAELMKRRGLLTTDEDTAAPEVIADEHPQEEPEAQPIAAFSMPEPDVPNVVALEPATEAATIICPECGKVMEAEARFCSSCGADLTNLTPDEQEPRTEVNG